VAWHVQNVAASFLCLAHFTSGNLETGDAEGHRKWFNPTKGCGFIKPAVGDKDVFVHISAVERAGLSTLNENQVVEYDLVENRGKTSAENLKVS
jgi:cold shock protein